jgi:hypothetical protein
VKYHVEATLLQAVQIVANMLDSAMETASGQVHQAAVV